MMSEKGLTRASLCGGVSLVVLACMFSGCDRGGSETEPVRKPPVSHMKDPELRSKLLGQREERVALERARQTIVEKMHAVAAKYGGDLKKAAEDPEMAALIRRARDIETNLSTNRAHAAEMIRASALRNAEFHRKSARKGAAETKALKKEVKQ